MRELDECGTEKFETLDSSEKPIAILSGKMEDTDRRPNRKERGSKSNKKTIQYMETTSRAANCGR